MTATTAATLATTKTDRGIHMIAEGPLAGRILHDAGDGSKVMINGRVWTFGSVAGYAAKTYLENMTNYNGSVRTYSQGLSLVEAIAEAVQRSEARREQMVWVTPDASVLLGAGYTQAREQFATMCKLIPHLELGSLVRIEGALYELAKGNHREDIRLVPVAA